VVHFLLVRLRVLRLIWMAWRACGNRIAAEMVTTLPVRLLEAAVGPVVAGLRDGNVLPGPGFQLSMQC
jgi:hypothetical protein